MSIVARAQKSNERKSREVVEMFAIVVTFYLFLNVSSSSSWMSWQARPTMKQKNDSFHPSIHPSTSCLTLLLSPLPNNPDPDDSQSDWPPLSSAVCGDRQETPFPPHLLHSDSIHISISWVTAGPGQALPFFDSLYFFFFLIPSCQVNWKWPSRKRRARDSRGKKKEEAGELTSNVV